jgi:IrrE N-terminal-like domain
MGPKSMPVSVEAYVQHVCAVLRRDADLDPDEPGWSFQNNGKHSICVNAKDPPERQRFTICHELAHIVLELPSEHKQVAWWSYAKRSPNEIACDIFATELLLPYGLFKPLAEKATMGLFVHRGFGRAVRGVATRRRDRVSRRSSARLVPSCCRSSARSAMPHGHARCAA